MERKELGRIQSARYGFGGYQDAQFGLAVTLAGKNWGTSDFHGFWGLEPSASAQWDAARQDQAFAETARHVLALLKEAGVQGVSDLVGMPVEVTFESNVLKSWRILTEVL